jgi:hypothetical protein
MRSPKYALLALAILALAIIAGHARAQDPYALSADYNRQRARHLFLTSPSPYRTYSSGTPGYSYGYSTPFTYGREWQTPSYRQERITPYGYQRYELPPVRGGYAVRRPVLVAPYPPPYPPPY